MRKKNERNKDEFNKGFLSRLFGRGSRCNVPRTPKRELALNKSEWLVGQEDKQAQESQSMFGWMTLHKYVCIVLLFSCAAVLFAAGCSSRASEDQSGQGNSQAATVTGAESAAEMAIGEASEGNRYIYLVFYKQNDSRSEEMKQVAAQAQQQVSAKADVAYIDVADESEKALIEKCGIDQASIPIVLVMAPNGAIVAGFPETVTSDDLTNAFVSPKTAEIIKATQDQKVIYLYVANTGMMYYQENLGTIQATAAKYIKEGYSQITVVDPDDKGEAALLEQCRVSTPVSEPNLLILYRGYIVGTLTGEIDEQTLLQTTQGGCGGGGCCG